MPLDVIFDHSRKWVVVRATGTITIGDVLQLIQTARANIEHRMWPMLFDARSATTTATVEDIERAVGVVREAVAAHGLRGHVALVAEDDVFYERLLLYETRCAESGVKVMRAFRRVEDGERWLEIVSAARYFR